MANWSVAVRFTRKGSTSTSQVTERVLNVDSEYEAIQIAKERVKNRSRDAENITASAQKTG
jgi:hypothetical protein